MNPRLLKLLEGNEDLYPHVLEARFPRVFNKLLELWQTPHIDAYLQDLMVDRRGGNREGFPSDAAVEILQLSNYLDKLHNVDKGGRSWSDIPEFKRLELVQYGYELSDIGLLKAVDNNHKNAVHVFLSCGVNLEVRDDRNWTPLMISAFNGNQSFVEMMLKCGARVATKDANGYTPLHWAAHNGHVDILKLLIEKGVEPDIKSRTGWTALMQAATRGHAFACAYLLYRGADVNASSIDGSTSLQKAIVNGHTEVVKLLLGKGAHRNIRYPDGTTPFDIAVKAGRADIIELLNSQTGSDAATKASSLRLLP